MPEQELLETIHAYLDAEWQRTAGTAHPRDCLVRNPAVFPATRLLPQLDSRDHDDRHKFVELYRIVAPLLDAINMMARDYTAQTIAEIVATIENANPAMVIDAGCGSGLSLGFLARQFPAVRFHGYDPSPDCLQITRRRLRALGLRNLRLVQSWHHDAGGVFTPRQADLVVANNSYLCPEDLSSVARLLRPGGLLLNLWPSSKEVVERMGELGTLLGLAEDIPHRRCFPEPRPDRPPFTDVMLLRKQSN